jgi:hypothetical protein
VPGTQTLSIQTLSIGVTPPSDVPAEGGDGIRLAKQLSRFLPNDTRVLPRASAKEGEDFSVQGINFKL